MQQNVHFANVDLEIESKNPLQPLLEDFGGNVDVLHHARSENGKYFASLEFHLDAVKSGIYGKADETIGAFCRLIENLPRRSRKIWDDCDEKRFDIGFESGNTKKAFNTKIQTETVKRIAEIGASVVITIYPVLSRPIKRKKIY